MTEKLLAVRKQVKSRKPVYKRIQSNQFAKLRNKQKWRRPKGMGNKDRRNRKGHIGMLKIGYGSPKAVRGLNRHGFEEVLVFNIADLSKITSKQQVAVISSTVGKKKRVEIEKIANEKKIVIANLKKVKEDKKNSVKSTKKKSSNTDSKKEVSKEKVKEDSAKKTQEVLEK